MTPRFIATPVHWLVSARRALSAARRVFEGELALREAAHSRAAAQQRRLREMTDQELLRASITWGGAVTYPELERRGLLCNGKRVAK